MPPPRPEGGRFTCLVTLFVLIPIVTAQAPIFQYLCNETSGATRLSDYSGNRYTAVPYSGGLSGSATFDGISISLTNTNNDYVQLPSGMAASLSNLGAWSFTAWIKGATTFGNWRMVHIGSDSNNNWYLSFRGGPKIRLGVIVTGGEKTSDSVSLSSWITVGSWAHVAVTCYVSGTNTLGSVYVDGVLRDSTLTVAKLSSDVGVAYPELYIGRDSSGSAGSYMYGNMKDIRVYDYTLSASQVLAIVMQNPSRAPTMSPTVSAAPTTRPTIAPTAPTQRPTVVPTTVPTVAPSHVPTSPPTALPTRVPTRAPTTTPTTGPPTILPTLTPTQPPTRVPTTPPTTAPTKAPTALPTTVPSRSPTRVPSTGPTSLPTVAPTGMPTRPPTVAPTALPTHAPTVLPAVITILSPYQSLAWGGYLVNGHDTVQFQGTSGNRTQGFRFTWSSPNSSVLLLSSGPYATISAGSMALAGQVYVLDMRVFSGATMTSKQLRLYANQSPYGGNCTTQPSKGQAFLTAFATKCSGWKDAESNLPLTYRFSARVVGSDGGLDEYLLAASSTNSSTRSRLPHSANVTIVTAVTDSMGASTLHLRPGINSTACNASTLQSVLIETLKALNSTTFLQSLSGGGSGSSSGSSYSASSNSTTSGTTVISIKDRALYMLLMVTTEVSATGGLTGTLRGRVLDVLKAILGATTSWVEVDAAEVLSQVLYTAATATQLHGLTSTDMADVLDIAGRVANVSATASQALGDNVVGSLSAALGAGLLTSAAASSSTASLDSALTTLTDRTMCTMVAGGGAKTYTSDNLAVQIDLTYAPDYPRSNEPYKVVVPEVSSQFSLPAEAIARLQGQLCSQLLGSQAVYWRQNKYLPLQLNSSSRSTAIMPQTSLSSVELGSSCDGSWRPIRVWNLSDHPVRVTLPDQGLASRLPGELHAFACKQDRRPRVMEAVCQYGPGRNTSADVQCDGTQAVSSYRCPPLGRCAFWNQTCRCWDDRGCVHRWASPGFGQAVCECSHLTTFAVVADTVDYVQAVLLSAGDIDAETIKRSLGLVLTIAAMYSAFLVLLCAIRVRRTRDSLEYISRVPASRMFQTMATVLLGDFKRKKGDKKRKAAPPAVQPSNDSLGFRGVASLTGPKKGKGQEGDDPPSRRPVYDSSSSNVSSPPDAAGQVRPGPQDLGDMMDAIIARRLRKLQGLRLGLWRGSVPCSWSGGSARTLPLSDDGSDAQSTVKALGSRLTQHQSLVIGFISFVTQLLLAIIVTGPNPPPYNELLPGWSSLTSTYLMALASNTVQQNLVTEPISRLLEALCYVVNKETSVRKSIAETIVDRDLPLAEPRPSSEVGRLAVPLLRVSLMQLELGLVALDASRLDAKGTKSLGALLDFDERLALIPLIGKRMSRHRKMLQDEYHACVEEYRAELQAAMHKSPGLLDQMRARLEGCRGTHASSLALKDFKSNPLEPFEVEQRLAGRFDDWVVNELYRYYLVDWIKRNYYWFFVSESQDHVAGQEFYLFSWRLLVCDLVLAVYLALVSFLALLLGLRATRDIVASSLLNMVSGVVVQYVLVSPLVSSCQSLLSRRLISVIEEDVRHSRLGFQAFIKYEQGSESDEAPIVSLEDYALQPGQAHQGAIVPIAAPPAQPQAATDKKAIAGDREPKPMAETGKVMPFSDDVDEEEVKTQPESGRGVSPSPRGWALPSDDSDGQVDETFLMGRVRASAYRDDSSYHYDNGGDSANRGSSYHYDNGGNSSANQNLSHSDPSNARSQKRASSHAPPSAPLPAQPSPTPRSGRQSTDSGRHSERDNDRHSERGGAPHAAQPEGGSYGGSYDSYGRQDGPCRRRRQEGGGGSEGLQYVVMSSGVAAADEVEEEPSVPVQRDVGRRRRRAERDRSSRDDSSSSYNPPPDSARSPPNSARSPRGPGAARSEGWFSSLEDSGSLMSYDEDSDLIPRGTGRRRRAERLKSETQAEEDPRAASEKQSDSNRRRKRGSRAAGGGDMDNFMI